MIDALLKIYDRNLDYACRLVADLDEAGMVAQPVPGMNHAMGAGPFDGHL